MRVPRTYDKLGAHPSRRDGQVGVEFAVWAPNARGVAVIGEFNGWDPVAAPMSRSEAGTWDRFVPGVAVGALYKYAITTEHGNARFDKADPHGFAAEPPVGTASRVWDLSRYEWGDGYWMARRPGTGAPEAPISMCQVDLSAWTGAELPKGHRATYREIAPWLAEYAREMGFTHVELTPFSEHSANGSPGRRTVNRFAPSPRFGTPDDFMFLVDALHQSGLGVVLDWMPAHFPGDSQGLVRFDGTPLYENAGRRGAGQDWNTYLFDYGKPEVADFLVSNALFWFEEYHVDGLRLDAVGTMLHRDDSGRAGDRAPEQFGGREDLEAISLIRRINDRVHAEFPGAITIAVESTAWPAVTRPTAAGGLGFDYEWDLGWTHDTVSYMMRDPIERKGRHDQLTFRTLYAFNENFVLPLARDESGNAAGSILERLPGDRWQKAANLRLIYGYMFAQPGKKLFFTGDELGAGCDSRPEGLGASGSRDAPLEHGLARWVRDLNTTYRAEPALHAFDCRPEGFSWIDCNDVAQSVLCLLRKANENEALILVICNFTPVPRHNYRVGVPRGGEWKEILNSDATIYGGSGQGNLGGVETSPVPWHGHAQSLNLTLPPLAVIAFRNGP